MSEFRDSIEIMIGILEMIHDFLDVRSRMCIENDEFIDLITTLQVRFNFLYDLITENILTFLDHLEICLFQEMINVHVKFRVIFIMDNFGLREVSGHHLYFVAMNVESLIDIVQNGILIERF